MGGHQKDKVAELDNLWETNRAHPSEFAFTPRSCADQFKSFSKHRSFSCFACVHFSMSLMWFFYPRASSGTLSQESKCGTPATASSYPMCLLCMCVHACICMCAHRISRIHYPLRLCTFMHDCPVHDTHACNIESPCHLTHKVFFCIECRAKLTSKRRMNSLPELIWNDPNPLVCCC